MASSRRPWETGTNDGGSTLSGSQMDEWDTRERRGEVTDEIMMEQELFLQELRIPVSSSCLGNYKNDVPKTVGSSKTY